jgi:hypothetical protein
MSREKKLTSKPRHASPDLEEMLTRQREFADSRMHANRVSSDFLKVDVATALTFSGIALSAQDPQKRARNQRAARKAYDTVLHLAPRVQLTHDDVVELKQNLSRLKSELRKLGEDV